MITVFAVGIETVSVVSARKMVITPAARSTVYRDTGGAYRETYAPAGPSVYLVRPDRHVGLRSYPVLPGAVRDHLATIFTNSQP